ncbi:MAG: type 4a pilus biogenesis protein PilO [Acidobacteriota bacterium]
MAALADFARMPTQRKVLVFVVIGLALGGLYYQFSFKGLKADIDEAEAQHGAKVALNKKLDSDKEDFKVLKLRNCQLKRIIDENQTALPTEAELPAFFETLNRKVLESGVEVRKWQQEKEEPVESFIKVPVQIELTGSYMQIKKFFASLIEKRKKSGNATQATATDTGCNSGPIEEHDRIVSIENLNLTNPTVVNHEIVLTAKFTAATYRKEEAPDQTTPGAPPQVKKAPPPAAGAPMPPAATPQGAKVRTEKAMDKDDSRTKNAPGVQDGSAKLKGGI